MNVGKKVSAVVLTLALLLSMCLLGACKDNNVSDNDKTSSNIQSLVNIPGGHSDVSEQTIQALLNSGEVYVYSCHVDDNDYSRETLGGFDKYFSEVYGGTLTTKKVNWSNWERTFIVDFAGGNAPDVVNLYYRAWPTLATRGMVYSASELKELGVVGLDHPYITMNSEMLSGTYTYRDELYGLALDKGSTGAVFLAVNTDLFDTYKVKSPVDYYKEGTWDIDTFKKCCAEISRSDSNKNIYGYFGWDPTFVFTSNDAYPVIWDKGVLKSNITDSKVINALNNYQYLYSNGYATESADDWNQGRCGMYAGLHINIHRNFGNGQVSFNYDVVPFPYGNDNTSGSVSGDITAYSITTSCQNVQGALNYIIARCAWHDYRAENGDDPEKLGSFNDEQKEMIKDYNTRIKDSLYYGVGNLDVQAWDFWVEVRKGTKSVKQAIDHYEPLFIAQCEVEMEHAKNTLNQ